MNMLGICSGVVLQGIPSVVQASLIPGLIGWGRARELLYFGEPIDADKALAWGFVNDVVSEDGLARAVAEWSDQFGKTGPKAMRLQKRLMRVREAYLLVGSLCFMKVTDVCLAYRSGRSMDVAVLASRPALILLVRLMRRTSPVV